jgi:hypothetical protein
MDCVECGKHLTVDENPWYEVAGFERPANQRGGQSGSSLVLRHPTGRALCGNCAISKVHGAHPQQGRLA